MLQQNTKWKQKDNISRLKIDDPLDAFAVHAGGGFWGLMSASIISHGGVAYALTGAVTGAQNSGDQLTQAFAVNRESSHSRHLMLFSAAGMADDLRVGNYRLVSCVHDANLLVFKQSN